MRPRFRKDPDTEEKEEKKEKLEETEAEARERKSEEKAAKEAMLQRQKIRAEKWIAELPEGCWCGYTDGGYTPPREATENRPAVAEKCGYGGTLQYRVLEEHGRVDLVVVGGNVRVEMTVR